MFLFVAFAYLPAGVRQRRSRKVVNNAMEQELSFKVVRAGKIDEVLTLDANPLVARAVYGLAVELLPHEQIELRQGTHVVEKSKPS
jgi:hypothetical protein